MRNTISPVVDPPGGAALTLLLRPREAAKALSISERTLWSLAKRGDVRAVRIGRAVAYSIDELRDFIRRRQADGAAMCTDDSTPLAPKQRPRGEDRP